MQEFRKPDSNIRGLLSVEALTRGFDVTDIEVLILARPLRKALAVHIQMLGRVMRTAPGKTFAKVLDHSGNCARFWNEWNDLFENGVSELDDGKKKEKKKPDKKPVEPIKCPGCGHMHNPQPTCPSCGHQYPKRQSVEHVAGTLKELLASGNRAAMTRELWPQIVHYARERRGDDGKKMALALYHQMTGQWPKGDFETTEPRECTREVRGKITALNIAWQRGRARAQQTAGAQA